MSSPSRSQQHLTPANLAMIEHALARVRLLYEFDRHSQDEKQLAAVMIGEFQRGNNTEDGLVAVFLGMSDTAVNAMRKIQMRKSLKCWGNEGGTAKPLTELSA
ncbi:hypothetical protein [Mesorhizobium sp. A623]